MKVAEKWKIHFFAMVKLKKTNDEKSKCIVDTKKGKTRTCNAW